MIRRIVLAAVVGALGFSLVPASATEHCDNPVNFLAGAGLLLNPRTVGCDGVAEDLGETPGDDSNTDWILPGSTQGVVRFLEGTEPVDGVRLGDGTVVGSRIEFNGITTALRFMPGTGLDGTPGAFYDSQAIPIGRQASLTGGNAVITVCRDAEALDCASVTYRTLGSA